MIERIIYTEKAGDDVAESYNWYESCEPGLGEDFLRCVEACVLTIQRHPQLYPVAVDEFRRGLFVVFLTRFSTSRLLTASLFFLFFTVPKIRRSGGSDLVSQR